MNFKKLFHFKKPHTTEDPELCEEDMRAFQKILREALDNQNDPAPNWYDQIGKNSDSVTSHHNIYGLPMGKELGMCLIFQEEDRVHLPVQKTFTVFCEIQKSGTAFSFQTLYTKKRRGDICGTVRILNDNLSPFISLCEQHRVRLGLRVCTTEQEECFEVVTVEFFAFPTVQSQISELDSPDQVICESLHSDLIDCAILHLLAPEKALLLSGNQLPVYESGNEIILQECAYQVRFRGNSSVERWLAANLSQIKNAENNNNRKKFRSARHMMLDINFNAHYHIECLPSLETAKKMLDDQLFGLETVKQRCLQILAMAKTTGKFPAAILLNGPPGTGKTEIARAIARLFFLPFWEIRAQEAKDPEHFTGSSSLYENGKYGVVFEQVHEQATVQMAAFFDEYDQLYVVSSKKDGCPSSIFRSFIGGDGFTDTFINFTIPTNQMLIIAACNNKELIADADLSRFSIIDVPAYSDQEKEEIFSHYVLPKHLKSAGIPADSLTISPDAVSHLCCYYSVNPGVRELEDIAQQLIGHHCVRVQQNGVSHTQIEVSDLRPILGVPPAHSKSVIVGPGMALGVIRHCGTMQKVLVEASMSPGTGKLAILNVPDSMKNCCEMAFACLKHSFPDFPHSRLDTTICIPDGLPDPSDSSIGLAVLAALVSAWHVHRGTNLVYAGCTAFFGGCDILGNAACDAPESEKFLTSAQALGVKTLFIAGLGVTLPRNCPVQVISSALVVPLIEMALKDSLQD